jgi:hypothetical protein
MPAQAGIHDLPSLQQRKSWIPACAGMTGVADARPGRLWRQGENAPNPELVTPETTVMPPQHAGSVMLSSQPILPAVSCRCCDAAHRQNPNVPAGFGLSWI